MDLLRNYPAGYNVLPTANPHDVVNVSLQLALYHLVDMVRPSDKMWGKIRQIVIIPEVWVVIIVMGFRVKHS